MFKFIAGLILLLFSWELVLFNPDRIILAFLLCLAGSVYLAFLLVSSGAGKFRSDRALTIAFNLTFFFWLLWVDFSLLRYLFPLLASGLILYAYFDRQKRPGQGISSKMSLVFFLGGLFFTSSVAIGLLTILEWPLWAGLLIFISILAVLGLSANNYLYLNNPDSKSSERIKTFLILLLLGAEIFAAVIWLPFSEFTLALILTLLLIFIYDFLKYFIDPTLLRRWVIVKKLIIYFVFLFFLLLSTPWF